jgi:hypothetical protein
MDAAPIISEPTPIEQEISLPAIDEPQPVAPAKSATAEPVSTFEPASPTPTPSMPADIVPTPAAKNPASPEVKPPAPMSTVSDPPMAEEPKPAVRTLPNLELIHDTPAQPALNKSAGLQGESLESVRKELKSLTVTIETPKTLPPLAISMEKAQAELEALAKSRASRPVPTPIEKELEKAKSELAALATSEKMTAAGPPVEPSMPSPAVVVPEKPTAPDAVIDLANQLKEKQQPSGSAPSGTSPATGSATRNSSSGGLFGTSLSLPKSLWPSKTVPGKVAQQRALESATP